MSVSARRPWSTVGPTAAAARPSALAAAIDASSAAGIMNMSPSICADAKGLAWESSLTLRNNLVVLQH
jgi:hypothetical protein